MTTPCLRFFCAFALLALSLAAICPAQAQNPSANPLPKWVVLDFTNHSGYGGGEVGRLASDAFLVELNKTNTYEIIPRQDVQQGMTTLGISEPLNLDNTQRMGRALAADAVVTGELASVSFTGNPRQARVGLVIRVIDTRSGELINGALAEGISNPRPVPTIDDDALITEALANAAFAAVNRQILRFNLPPATVLAVKDANTITLNRGTRDGFYATLEMMVVRGGVASGNAVMGGTVVGKIRVGAVTRDSAEATIIGQSPGIQPNDRAVPLYSVPAYVADATGIHAPGHPNPSLRGFTMADLKGVTLLKIVRPGSVNGADKMASSDNQFGFDMLAKVDKDGGNVFFSPASLALALAMTYNGAGGETRQAMAQTLHLQGMPVPQVNAANASLMQSLADPEPAPKEVADRQYFEPRPRLDIANALWADKDVTFAPDFQQRVQQSYGAEAATLDFHSPAAAPKINGWVSKHTQGMIDSILTPGDLRGNGAVLTNAVYFKARWTHLFSAAATQDGPFTQQDGATRTLPLMTQTETFPYLETKDFQAVALPYGRGRLSLYVFLPRPESNLTQFVGKLGPQTWDDWLTQFKPQSVDITLPRFTANYDAEMSGPLASLGMGAAFKPGADFEPMGLAGFYISKVKHKAVLKVNEKGTEAAAATAVLMTRGGHFSPSNPIVMRVDRPFFCAIRDNATGLILFLGLIRDPKG